MPKLNGKKIIMPAATFLAAISIGFAVQNADALAAKFGNDGGAAGSVAPQVPELAIPDSIAPLPSAADVLGFEPAAEAPAEFGATAQLASAGMDYGLGSNLTPMGDLQGQIAPLEGCDITVTAESGPMATAILTVEAPCGGAGVIHHQGMMFSFATDAAGKAQMAVPALAEKAVFIVEMNGGVSAVAVADVPDLAQYDRAVLQWQGKSDIHLHASEFGARNGAQGHVWAEAPGSIDAVEAGTGGQIMVLGANASVSPFIAEIYTYPKGNSLQAGEITLSAEIGIDEATCGRDIAAQSIQVGAGGALSAVDLTMTVPGCDAMGSYLIVPAMFTPYQVALAG